MLEDLTSEGSLAGWPPLKAPEAQSAADPAAASADESTEFSDAHSVAMADWRAALMEDFEAWLDQLEELPASEGPEGEEPDLYSFYEQLAASNAEARKASRRTAEAISQWGETLSRFDSSLLPLREAISQLTAAQPKTGQMSRPHCLALVELLDRLERIGGAFDSPPPRGSWWSGNDGAWRQAWERQHQAFAIVLSHLEGLLRKENVVRFEVLHQLFDPSVMTAVASEPAANVAPQTVLEELAAGYRHHGELLRTAQVKVSRAP